jgi:hypothetical protein
VPQRSSPARTSCGGALATGCRCLTSSHGAVGKAGGRSSVKEGEVRSTVLQIRECPPGLIERERGRAIDALATAYRSLQGKGNRSAAIIRPRARA